MGFVLGHGGDASSEAAPARARSSGGFRCEGCGGSTCKRFLRANTVLRRCSGCRHRARLRAGTVFENSKLTLTTWFMAAYLLVRTKTKMTTPEPREVAARAIRSGRTPALIELTPLLRTAFRSRQNHPGRDAEEAGRTWQQGTFPKRSGAPWI